MLTLQVLAQLLIFFTALVGILGPTYQEGDGFLRRITPLGWIAAVFAFLSLVIALTLTLNQARDLAREQARANALTDLAQGEIQSQISHIWDVIAYAVFFSCPDIRDEFPLFSGFGSRRDLLKNETVLSCLEETSLTPRRVLGGPYIVVPYGTDPRKADEVISQEMTQSLEKLGSRIDVAGPFLAAEVTRSINKLRQDEFFLYLSQLNFEIKRIITIEDSYRYPFPLLNSYVSGATRSDYLLALELLEDTTELLEKNY